ncbi:MAG TPA: VWA domain-containing protein [Pirellulales bacterium]|jgi:hypothetical protein|nr:VWA domain-containing protein [Pirellulales bacterium]
MFLRASAGLVIAAATLAAAPNLVDAADYQAFLKARRQLENKLKNPNPDVRREAIASLGDYAFEDSARFLMLYGLVDDVEQNRRTAYDTLLKINRQQEVCDFLIAQLNVESRRGRPGPVPVMVMGVLLSSPIENIDRSTMRYLDEDLPTVKDGGAFLVFLADLLAMHGDLADLAPLVKITRTRLFEQEFGVRRATLAAFSCIEHNEAIDALVTLLPKLEGEAHADAYEHLARVSGQKFPENDQWAKWWKENKATFVYPKLPPKPVERPLQSVGDLGGRTSYYGLPLYAQRMVFVVDCSGSMDGPRIAAAKRELSAAIQGLKANTFFSIVAYNAQIECWRRQLVDASTANKADAQRFVAGLVADDRTATYDALDTAFYFNAESIYLLTDGAPSAGRIVDKPEIVEAIGKQNRTRRESIYTIGLAPGLPGSDFDVFLAKLAQNNYGIYRRVDE